MTDWKLRFVVQNGSYQIRKMIFAEKIDPEYTKLNMSTIFTFYTLRKNISSKSIYQYEYICKQYHIWENQVCVHRWKTLKKITQWRPFGQFSRQRAIPMFAIQFLQLNACAFLVPATATYDLCSQVTAGIYAQHKQLVFIPFWAAVHSEFSFAA